MANGNQGQETELLDQADIDALLGTAEGPPLLRSGIHALVNAKTLNREPLPMLEVICDRALPALAAGMRNLTSEAVEVSLDQVGSGRFGELMSLVPLPALFGVFSMPPLEGHGVMVLEPDLIYALLDALMGGHQAASTERGAARSFTFIETGLMASFMTLVLKEFGSAFDLVAPVTPKLERSEALPRFAAVVGPAVGSAHCRFRVDLDGCSGRFTLLLPTTTLEPVREKLAQRFLGDSIRGNAAWSEHFERELCQTTLRVRAVLAEQVMSLQHVLRFAPGQTIPLGRAPHASVAVDLEGVPAGTADMGQRNNHVCIRLLRGLEVS